MADYESAGVNFREYRGYRLERRDPFGHWAVKTASGTLPKELNQMFTETRYATNAVDTYLSKKSKKEK